MERLQILSLIAITATCLSSCETLNTTAVAYQSVRPKELKPEPGKDAKILVAYSISADGNIYSVVRNLTDEIMVVDQVKSFFVNSDGKSISYYDPTVRTTSVTDLSSSTSGASVNLGSIGSAIGIGGVLGSVLNGVNVGGSSTAGTSTTQTTYTADMPQISIGPQGMASMSKHFQVGGVGRASLSGLGDMAKEYSSESSYCQFSVCITYSVDGGETFDKLTTNFYVNSVVSKPVADFGKVNAALRNLLNVKSDAIREPWWLLYSVSNLKGHSDNITNGAIIDYQ